MPAVSRLNSMTPTESDTQYVNLVRVACSRPKMYIAYGTLADLYALMIGHEIGSKTQRQYLDVDRSACLAIAWLHEHANDPCGFVCELLDTHWTDEAALWVTYDLASTLPPAPHMT